MCQGDDSHNRDVLTEIGFQVDFLRRGMKGDGNQACGSYVTTVKGSTHILGRVL